MNTAIPQYSIYAPLGAFGNHVRWLALLDDRYHFQLDGVLLDSAQSKVSFIQQYVYNDSREANNWLEYEWKWRRQLDPYLKFTHDMADMFDGLKTIGLTIDPDMSYNCYIKFNPNLNGIDRLTFLKQTDKINKMSRFAQQCIDTFKSMDSSILYQDQLDKNFYHELTDFFNLNPTYSQAQEIHSLWFRLHQQAQHQYQSNFSQPHTYIGN